MSSLQQGFGRPSHQVPFGIISREQADQILQDDEDRLRAEKLLGDSRRAAPIAAVPGWDNGE